MEKTYTLYDLLNCSNNEEIQEILDTLDRKEEKIVEAILEQNYWKYDTEKKQDLYTIEDLQDAVDEKENRTHFLTMDDYYDYCDDLLNFSDPNSIEARYFDYDAYHRDCEYDVTEASNGVVLADW